MVRQPGFVRNKPSIYIDRDYCIGCMKCVRLCPQKHVLEPARDEHGPYSHVTRPPSFAPDADCACRTAPPMLSESS